VHHLLLDSYPERTADCYQLVPDMHRVVMDMKGIGTHNTGIVTHSVRVVMDMNFITTVGAQWPPRLGRGACISSLFYGVVCSTCRGADLESCIWLAT
jgi:hypothetical protein